MAHLPDLVMEMFRLTVQALQQKLWADLVIYKATLWRLYDGSACFCPLVVSVQLWLTLRVSFLEGGCGGGGGSGGQGRSGLCQFIVDGH